MLREEIVIETMPVGELGIIPLKGSKDMVDKVDYYISTWRKNRENPHENDLGMFGYERDSYIVRAENPRFGSGEAKGVILDSVRGMDLFIFVDVCNHSIEYSLSGKINHMSPDDHFQDLKRIIAAVGGKARRLTVIMPFLYESRQHKRQTRESLDCALGLEELYNMGVDNIITFDAHDPRVINSAPLHGFENVKPSYQFLKYLCKVEKNIQFDKDHLIFISPDEGALERGVYFASVLGVEMGTFYKRRDYSVIENGMNPIVAHEYLGPDLSGKDVIVVDDMISSGGSMLDTSKALKERGANRVYIFSTFGLFTNGLDKFDEAYKNGWFDRVLTTNLTYQMPELLEREYYTSVDMSKYISYIVDTLNHDASVSDLLDPSVKIKELIVKYSGQDGPLTNEQMASLDG